MPSTLWTGTDYVCDVVARQTRHMKFRKIVDAVHHIRVLLNDVRQGLGINECDRQLFAERIVVPIHPGLSKLRNSAP